MAVWCQFGFTISTEKSHLDLQSIHHYLSKESYWAQGISLETVTKAIENSSVCFGIYHGNPHEGAAQLVGFARVVTDMIRFGWIMDVFVLEAFRGKGLSKWLLKVLTEQSELKDVGKLMLTTHDAHGLYAQFGFEEIENPEFYMQRKKK